MSYFGGNTSMLGANQAGAAGSSGKVVFSFPILKRQEIVQCMNELNIPLTEDDLKEPSPASMRLVYDSFVELILGVSKEDMVQPQFITADLLEYPELHEESIPELVSSVALTKLMNICGVKDFTMGDIYKPDPNRTKTNLSALINFTKFREEHLMYYQQLIVETDTLQEKKQALEDSTQTLASQVRVIRAQREEEQPMVDDMQRDVLALQAEVNTLNKLQAQLQGDIRKIKDETAEKADSIASSKFAILGVKQDSTKIRSQIVPAPDKLRKEIVDMTVSLQNEKEARVSAERRARDLSAKLEAIEKTDQDIRKAIKQLEDVGMEINKYKAAVKAFENTQDAIASQQAQAKELDAQEQQLKRQLMIVQEKMVRLEKQQEMRRAAAEQAIETMRQEQKSFQAERSATEMRIEQNNSLVKDLADKKSHVLQQHAAEIAAVQQTYAQLCNQIGEYHQTLLQSLTEVVQ